MRSDCSIAHRDAYHILNLFDTNATLPLQVELLDFLRTHSATQ